MNNTYQTNVHYIMTQLISCGYSGQCVHKYSVFYQRLGAFIEKKKTDYSSDIGEEFLLDPAFSHRKSLFLEKSALAKLRDVYEFGSMQGMHMSHMFLSRTVILPPSFIHRIDEYADEISGTYSSIQISNIRGRCGRFLRYLLSRGVNSPERINYTDILSYHDSLDYMKEISRIVEESSVKDFLSYLEKRGYIHMGLSLYLYSLETDSNRIYDHVPKECADCIEAYQNESHTVPVGEMYTIGLEIIKKHTDAGYSPKYIDMLELTLDRLYLFLDINGLSFHLAITDLWCRSERVREYLGHGPIQTLLRLSWLIESYYSTGCVNLKAARIRGIARLNELPEWCRIPLGLFAEEKRREKLEDSTVNNYIYSCMRFCEYLVAQGLDGFGKLDANVISNFNLYDRHGSPEGKSSCNCRIRKFLKFLWRKGFVEEFWLYGALVAPSAPRESNVIILNDDEISVIRNYVSSASTSKEIRNSAMLLIGTEMGIRGCDIVKLRLGDIDWKRQMLRFSQDKGGTDVCLYMPASVGNAIYRYIRDARPKCSRDDHIFLRHEAPYCRLTRNACYSALKEALPLRDVDGSGFHVTRKTFATARLRDGVQPDKIADVMGHSGTESLKHYLSLDTDRMKLCPLSLESIGIGRKGGLNP